MCKITIAIDAMGGDFGPHIPITAAATILQSYPNLSLIIVGDKEHLLPLLKKNNLLSHSRLSYIHCENFISMDDKPASVLRHCTGSSMQIVLDLVARGKADACVSGGNTGALMLLAKKTLKTLPGISRPALIATLPNNDSGHTYLLDLGANIQCDSDTLFNFALMGSVLCEKIEQIPSASVSLLNIGKEDNKGSEQIKRCAELLKQSKHINYSGYVEANELFTSPTNVIVTDGFSGNIALKSCEGLGRVFLGQIEKAIDSNIYSRLLGKLLRNVLTKQLKHLHPDMYNGASLIGLRGIVVKSHGSANATAFAYAIEQAIKETQWQIPTSISTKLETVLLERDCLSHE
ncbi:MAG: phosphate acyltransferase PlsX [Psychromonas sp.]